MTLRKVAAVAAVAAGLFFTGAAPALAASGTAYTSDTGDTAGRTEFDDGGDIYTVYDMDNDNEGVVGWIEVKQADGSWKKYPKVYVGTGNDTHKGNNVDVTREAAQVKIVACRQNGSTGTPYSCGTTIVSGS